MHMHTSCIILFEEGSTPLVLPILSTYYFIAYHSHFTRTTYIYTRTTEEKRKVIYPTTTTRTPHNVR